MKQILRELNQKPIAYYPVYRQITGSTTGGILLSQLMYWFAKKDKIFKTDKEIMEETMLTKKELENSKKLIKQLDFITVSREGIPAKTYYEIDWEKFEKYMGNHLEKEETSNHDTGKQVSTNGGNCVPPMGESNIDNKLSISSETTTKRGNVVVEDSDSEETFGSDGEFNTYYSELRFIGGKYVGKKEDAYKSYLKVKGYLNIKVLVEAYREYVKSVKTHNGEKIQGFKKFIDNEMYLAFLPKKVEVLHEKGRFEGHYEQEILRRSNGSNIRIPYPNYLQMIKNHQVKFLEVV